MEYVIGIITVLLVFFVTGYILRKKYYKEIDRLESWKIEILNRPVLDEMSKVKQLNMTGQTEELFDRWRKEWDDIVATQLPKLEDLLFDAEEYIDKYRFKKANEIQLEINSILTETEEKIKNILTELHELVGSEQKNRIEIEELKDLYRECRKTLLAHNHTFGASEKQLELQLDEIVTKFQEFEEKTENGNYLEAREGVLSLKERLNNISSVMASIPRLLVECQSGVPMLINEIRDGYREMLEQGYHLDQLQFEDEMFRIEMELKTFVSQLEMTETMDVENGLESVKAKIDEFYDLLEKEVHAKHFIQTHDQETKDLIEVVVENNKNLNEETELVQHIYHLSEKELEVNRQSEKQLSDILNKYEQLYLRIQQQQDFSQTSLSQELREIRSLINELLTEQNGYREVLQALRKDEVTAREKVQELAKKVGETIRSVTKSKIPGLPQDYRYLLDDAQESIQTVISKLEEKPLDIPTIQHYLDMAVHVVEKLTNTTNEMMDNVVLAERVIQYGNRYRSRYPSVARGLLEAELAFRTFDYKTALEHAVTTIDQVEPGAIKKIEDLLREEVLI